MSAIELLCTDLDGTLIEFSLYSHCTEEFSETLFSHKKRGGSWVINTGRSFLHTLEGLEQFQPPVRPDYLITHEREVYHWSPFGEWVDFGNWNRVCKERHRETLLGYENKLKIICQQLSNREKVTLLHEEDGLFTGIMTSTEEEMEQVCLQLEEVWHEFPEFSYQRNTIYLRFCLKDYHKGSALGELCRLTNICRENVFSVGDNFNDISMLDGTYAAMCACPANAVESVKQTVLKAQGFVASKNYVSGVREAIEHFLIL